MLQRGLFFAQVFGNQLSVFIIVVIWGRGWKREKVDQRFNEIWKSKQFLGNENFIAGKHLTFRFLFKLQETRRVDDEEQFAMNQDCQQRILRQQLRIEEKCLLGDFPAKRFLFKFPSSDPNSI